MTCDVSQTDSLRYETAANKEPSSSNYYHTEFGKVNMVNWKVALAVIVIAVLLMAIGMWFGYRYVSEQDDISPAGWREPAHTVSPPCDKPLAVLAALREKIRWSIIAHSKHYGI